VRFGQVGESGIITYYWQEVARMHRRQGLSVEAIARSVNATPDEVQLCLYSRRRTTNPSMTITKRWPGLRGQRNCAKCEKELPMRSRYSARAISTTAWSNALSEHLLPPSLNA
jgi:hypothetical protein